MYKSNLDRLLYIMEKLRDKENGCVWCKEQTPQSLSKYAIEEAYELSDAVIKDDVEEYKKELGDLLYQVVFHAQIAKEKELFDFDDIASSIADKLTNRNTHIFGNNKAETIEEIDALWQKRKEEEKTKSLKDESILSEVSGNLPALLEGLKITEKAASKGFEWENVNKVIDVVRDELNEVEAEITKEYKDKDKILDEVGDVLFSAINLARRTEVDPEIALKHANQKFRRRYGFVENKHKQNNLDFSNTSLDEKLKYWKEAKKEGL